MVDLSDLVPRLPGPAATRLRDHDHVSWFTERIEKQIQDFAEELPEGSAVQAAVMLPNGSEITASFFGFHGPDMLVVHGFDSNGVDCRVLVAHRTAHIVLTAVPKEAQKPRTIGFQSRDEAEQERKSDDGRNHRTAR